MSNLDRSSRLSTGIDGLDHILGGGLPAGRLYLVTGHPGTGKTTLALQFLLEGLHRGESILYFAFSETPDELQSIADSHGWAINPENILAITPALEGELSESYTLFHPSEVELDETLKSLCREVERVGTLRIVIDSLAEMRLQAQDPLLYRRQILSLKPFFSGRHSTVLLLDDLTGTTGEHHFHSLVHGVISLQQSTPLYGGKRRQLEIVKLRGAEVYDGRHDFVIRKGGIIVYPRLSPAEVQSAEAAAQPTHLLPIESGVEELDILLGKGLDRGTSTLLIGPSGVGKSTLAMQYVLAGAQRDEHASVYCFDEEPRNVFVRMTRLGMDIRNLVDGGQVAIHQINTAEVCPGEFAHGVKQAVEKNSARMIVIDSLNGYLNAMPDERTLLVHMHDLLAWLNRHEVISLVTLTQSGLVGQSMKSPIDVSYLADGVILLRYFEAGGEVRRAISVLKKRTGAHESTIREFQIGPRGVRCGAPLREFHGVLTGVPTWGGRNGLLSPAGTNPSGEPPPGSSQTTSQPGGRDDTFAER